MTIRERLLAAAARGAAALSADQRTALEAYLAGRINEDGGCRGRSQASDLYYTMFAVQCAMALGQSSIGRAPWAGVHGFLRSFADGEALDLVHMACLARARADLGSLDGKIRSAMALGLDRFRCRDGGYHPAHAGQRGTAYGAFLALGAYEDLADPRPAFAEASADKATGSRAGLPDPGRLADSIEALRTADGGYCNDPASPLALVPATAAVVSVLVQLGRCVDAATTDWLLAQRDVGGGFRAAPEVPIADLLSTATALHALRSVHAPLADAAPTCRRYVEGLWRDEGGFRGGMLDETVDCEYTFYGLLALGHLAER